MRDVNAHIILSYTLAQLTRVLLLLLLPPRLQVSANSAIKIRSSSLLMTCRVLIKARDESFVKGRALLDKASSASFISERLARNLQLPQSPQTIHIFWCCRVIPQITNPVCCQFSNHTSLW